MASARIRLFVAGLAAAGAILLAAAAAPSGAVAAIYWGLEGGMGIANLDGTSVEAPIAAGDGHHQLDTGYPCGVAVDAGHVYWVDTAGGTIGRAGLDGSSPDESFIEGLTFPCGVVVHGSHLYWADIDTGTIGRANLDGGDVDRSFIVGGDAPCGVAANGSHLFWANRRGGTIGRANLDGTGVDQAFVPVAKSPCGVAVSSSHVYWGSPPEGWVAGGTIGRANLDGGAADNSFIVDVGEPWGIAVNGTHVYWTDQGWRNFLQGGSPLEVLPGAVGRARVDGSEVSRRFIPTGLARGIALDTRALPVEAAPLRPSDYLRFGKVTHDRRRGTLRLIVHVPARGELQVNSRALGWRIEKGNPPPWVGGSFRWKLALWPQHGSAGKPIRQRLRRRGRAPLLLRVTYTQEGRLPLRGSKRLTLIRARPRADAPSR